MIYDFSNTWYEKIKTPWNSVSPLWRSA